MWVAIVKGIWDQRNMVIFKQGVPDAEEVFQMAQLRSWLVYRTNTQELQNLNKHKFDSLHTFRNLPIFYVNKHNMCTDQSLGVVDHW